MSQKPPPYKRRWRYYRTSGGACPIEQFLDDLSDADAEAVLAVMKEVREEGTRVAHFIRNEIYEVLGQGGAAMSEHYDDLDAYIAKRATKNPAFPTMVDAALKQRRLLRELAAKRVEMGLSQKTVAALMGTTQPALARLERGEIDPKLSTLERYAEALGRSIAVI